MRVLIKSLITNKIYSFILFFIAAQIIQFQQLCMVLAGGEGITADVILKTLPKVAVLVRGNWVVKSEVLYPANTFSSTSGVPAELMCRARDYVVGKIISNRFYCFYVQSGEQAKFYIQNYKTIVLFNIHHDTYKKSICVCDKVSEIY